jgi:hypothetical protein
MKLSETKRNFTCDETKRNETKFHEIYFFAKHAKFRETGDEFRLVSCFAKLKKHAKLETLLGTFCVARKGPDHYPSWEVVAEMLCK